MISGKDIVAFVLAAALTLGPLAAGMIASRTAGPATIAKSGATAPGDTAPTAGR